MYKKGDTNTPYFVIGLILAVLILIFGSYLINKTQKTSGTTLSPELKRIEDKSCLYKTQQDQEMGKKIIDIDNDQRADYCDICVNGNNNEDRDGDGMPDNCDKAPDDDTISECGRTLLKNKRCSA